MPNRNLEIRGRCRPLMALVLAGLTAGLAATGCRSSGPKVPHSSGIASIVVQGKTTEEIGQAVSAVFAENLYETSYAGPEKFVFEKPGSRMSELTYGTMMDNEVWIRVKLNIIRFGTDLHLVGCDAFIVRDRGDSAFEEEQKLTKMSRRPYKKLLRQVQDRLE